MSTTTNIGLIKPEITDNIKLSDFNTNMDKIDSEIAKPYIEIIENENGQARKYEDGTLICTQHYMMSWTNGMDASEAFFYIGFSDIKPYPLPFIKKPEYVNIDIKYINGWGGKRGSFPTSGVKDDKLYSCTSLYIYSQFNNPTGTADIDVLAIGRWK